MLGNDTMETATAGIMSIRRRKDIEKSTWRTHRYFVDFESGTILVNLPSIRRRNSTGKIRRNYINFEKRIHVEIITAIRRGNFDVDSTFKIDEISMSSPYGFFYVVSILSFSNIFCSGNLF